MNKFHAKRTFLDGRWFASKLESQRYLQLKIMEGAGVIRGLECQPKFDLWATNLKTKKPKKIGRYTADFRYIENGEEVYEDVKGRMTKDADLRIKMVEASYGIEIRLIRKNDM